MACINSLIVKDTERQLSALDFELIRQLLAKGSHSLDSGDLEKWVSCFCQNGQFEIIDGASAAVRVYSGRDELRHYAQLTSLPEKAGTTRRWLNMPIITGGAGAARVRTYEMQYSPNNAKGCIAIASGIVDSELIQIEGEWLYSKFRLKIEDFDHQEWTESAMAGLMGCGCHTPHIDIWRGKPHQTSVALELDHELILRTLAEFLFYMDNGSESERLAALFTEDGLWQLFGVDRLYRSGVWHGKSMEPAYKGRAAIRLFNQTAHAKRKPWDRHWGHPPLINIEGDVATAIFPYTTVLAGVDKNVRAMIAGVYHDRLRKVEGQWQIEECSVFIERTPGDLADVAKAAAGQYVGGVD